MELSSECLNHSILSHLFLPPLSHRVYYRKEGLSVGCNRILDSWGDFWEDFPGQDPIGLQFSQLFGQHLFADDANLAMQFAEPVYVITNQVENEGFPLASDLREAERNGAVVLGRLSSGWVG